MGLLKPLGLAKPFSRPYSTPGFQDRVPVVTAGIIVTATSIYSNSVYKLC
jgi:hypothetical protein